MRRSQSRVVMSCALVCFCLFWGPGRGGAGRGEGVGMSRRKSSWARCSDWGAKLQPHVRHGGVQKDRRRGAQAAAFGERGGHS